MRHTSFFCFITNNYGEYSHVTVANVWQTKGKILTNDHNHIILLTDCAFFKHLSLGKTVAKHGAEGGKSTKNLNMVWSVDGSYDKYLKMYS